MRHLQEPMGAESCVRGAWVQMDMVTVLTVPGGCCCTQQGCGQALAHCGILRMCEGSEGSELSL